jgi:branched-chain amino acid transport system substrate-binding protein
LINQATTKIKKEVDTLKKILFISLVVVLALSVGLIGCEGEGEGEGEPDTTITIGVCGPMTDLQGQNHWDGAQMAAQEINDAGGVDVGATTYDVEVIQVETEESTEGEDGSTGTTNINAVIDDVDFFVGGFRTEVVSVYRDAAIDAGVLFMNCGAATGALQFSVVTDYANYKYWFKATPYNETFLVKSCIRMTATVGGTLGGTLAYIEGLNPAWVQDEYKMSLAVGGKPRVEILMEDAAWCAGMVPAAQYYLPLSGFNVTGTTLVSPTASDISTELSAIAANNPHIIFTAFSGSVGAVYSIQKDSLGIPAMSIGINVPAQQISHWANTGGTCKGEVLLDTWADGLNITPYTHAWFEDFMSRTGRYPVYTAGTYDAIKIVCKAIDETDSVDSDDLVDWLEDPANANEESVASPKVGFYQMPAVTVTPGELYGLNQSQVEVWYDLDSYGWAFDQNEWLCGFVTGVQQPHIAHDLVYGPGLTTGVGAQWQEIASAGKKVGIWPMIVGAPSVDQYGDWNFQYEGTEPLYLPIGSDESTGGMLTIPNPL